MAVVTSREILPRTLQHRFGESPTAERRFAVTVDSSTTTHADVIAAVGIFHGDAHPEYSYLRMLDASLSESSPDPYHVELVYRYEVPKQDEYDPNPLLRPDVWSFSTSGAAVPAIAYYAGDKLAPLVNAAGELIEGAMTEEAELRATIAGNRARFPLDIAAYVTNAVNDAEYLGCPAYTWKCQGIGAQQAVEIVNDVEVRFYQVTAELVYRSSGWPLLLPDVGWNFLANKVLKRCFRLNDENLEVPSANPVALAADGRMLAPGVPPRLLVRRVHRAITFSTYFGTPQF